MLHKEEPLWPAEYLPDNPETAWKFVIECCRTWNEASKKVQRFPKLKYLKHLVGRWCHCRTHGGLLIIEKCRRMVVSWLFRALELWVMGRERSDEMLAGETFAAAARHVWRLQHIYDDLRKQFPLWNLPECHTIAYEGENSLKIFSLRNGSVARAINGQGEKLQGEGTAIIVLEEAHQYPYLSAMLSQASVITLAEPGAVGGMIIVVANASANDPWQKIKKAVWGERTKYEIDEVLPGLRELSTTKGGGYIHLEYFADPGKDAAWLRSVALEMVNTPREYRREILMDDTIHAGDPVWTEYVPLVHEFPRDPKEMIYGKDGWVDGTFYGGWDTGTSRMPAFCLAFLTKRSKQLRFCIEVVPETSMSMELFAPMVKRALKLFLPGRWMDVIHVGDETVRTKGGNIERSAGDIAMEHGFNIKPVSNNVDRRERAVIHLMTDWCETTGGPPRLLFSTKGCPVLVEGNRGAYHTQKRPGSADSGPGLQVTEPAKNYYSHVNDGMQYICVVVSKEILRGKTTNRARRM